jgi:hypothetical protein
MEKRVTFWKILKWLLILVFKIFIVLLWGALRLIEVILQNLNPYLKKLIT